jgi:hypothetical protein
VDLGSAEAIPEGHRPDEGRVIRHDQRCYGCTPVPVIWPGTTPLKAALDYANHRGWHVFPVPPNTKRSYKNEEFSGSKWGMTKDAGEIKRDFAKWSNAGVGIPTGIVNGFFVIEADTKRGHGVDGIASLRQLEEQYGDLPETRMAISPSGSLHYYFRHPGDDIKIKNSSSELAQGVDVRGDGGMVIAPPTRRTDGQYRWLNNLEIADPPRWLLDLIDQTGRRVNGPTRRLLADVGRGVSTDPDDLPEKVSVAKIKTALAAITDCTHQEWVAILSGVFKELGDEAGLEVIDAWASTNPKLKRTSSRRIVMSVITARADIGCASKFPVIELTLPC